MKKIRETRSNAGSGMLANGTQTRVRLIGDSDPVPDGATILTGDTTTPLSDWHSMPSTFSAILPTLTPHTRMGTNDPFPE